MMHIITGWQRAPEGKVTEVTQTPDPKTFWTESVKPKKPLVMRLQQLISFKAMKRYPKFLFSTTSYNIIVNFKDSHQLKL